MRQDTSWDVDKGGNSIELKIVPKPQTNLPKSTARKSKGATQKQKFPIGYWHNEIDLSVGGHCRAVYRDDGVEYEATIMSVEPDEEGNLYAYVRLGFAQSGPVPQSSKP